MRIVSSACIPIRLAMAGCAETSAPPQPAQRAVAQRAGQATPPPSVSPLTVRAHGMTAELPPGWQAAPESLTPHLTDPREELAVGTYPLRYRPPEGGHKPARARDAPRPGPPVRPR